MFLSSVSPSICCFSWRINFSDSALLALDKVYDRKSTVVNAKDINDRGFQEPNVSINVMTLQLRTLL